MSNFKLFGTSNISYKSDFSLHKCMYFEIRIFFSEKHISRINSNDNFDMRCKRVLILDKTHFFIIVLIILKLRKVDGIHGQKSAYRLPVFNSNMSMTLGWNRCSSWTDRLPAFQLLLWKRIAQISTDQWRSQLNLEPHALPTTRGLHCFHLTF